MFYIVKMRQHHFEGGELTNKVRVNHNLKSVRQRQSNARDNARDCNCVQISAKDNKRTDFKF